MTPFKLMVPVIMAKGGDLEQDMKYDYRSVGREYESEILNEAESQGR